MFITCLPCLQATNSTIMANENDKAILNSIFNPFLPLGESSYEEELPESLTDEEVPSEATEKSRQLEIEAMKATESGEFDMAIGLFSLAIDLAPNRASPFNNRAQTHRLKGDENTAILDLNRAIELSNGRGRSACQALCQRGLLRRKVGEEVGAKEDFTTAARLGSGFAKSQLVEMNPYAALCNQMLSQVIGKLRDVPS